VYKCTNLFWVWDTHTHILIVLFHIKKHQEKKRTNHLFQVKGAERDQMDKNESLTSKQTAS